MRPHFLLIFTTITNLSDCQVSSRKSLSEQTSANATQSTRKSLLNNHPSIAAREEKSDKWELPEWKSYPRDCSDAPNKDIRHTCLMLRDMDRQTRKRLKRQSLLTGASPSSPRLSRLRASQRRRQQLSSSASRQRTQRPVVNTEDFRRDGSPNWQQPVPVPPFARGQTAYHPYDCMTIACLCPFFGGAMRGGTCILRNGSPLTMAYRKEYRMLTENERARWHAALNTLKRNGEYDRLSRSHLEVGVGSGAHSGPGFLPWHREYLKRVEIALRMVDPTIAIPYWDSVIDNYLIDPRDSIFFSNLFAGETDFWGNVVQGPFAYWPTLEGRPTILRQLGREGSLFTEAQISNIAAQNAIQNVLAYTAPLPQCPYPNNYGAVEYVHSNIHLWLGGDMKPPATSANEPIFFMHHSFVDYLWELWRQLRQPKYFREQDYTPDVGVCANWQHFSYANMRPFPYLLNRDGLSNSYTDQMYRYAPRPSCSVANPRCGSPFLFCDLRGFPHCVAKVKLGGLCRGYETYDVCYVGRCWFGRCVQAPGRQFKMLAAKSIRPNSTAIPLPPKAPSPGKMFTSLFVDCFNRHPCCDRWAEEGKCEHFLEYMSQFCQVSCEVCEPAFNTTDECGDRHTNCAAFTKNGMCTGASSNFMSENCRDSCGLCTNQKDDVCYADGELIAVPSTEKLEKSIRYSFDADAERKLNALKQAVKRSKRRRAKRNGAEILSIENTSEEHSVKES